MVVVMKAFRGYPGKTVMHTHTARFFFPRPAVFARGVTRFATSDISLFPSLTVCP